MVKKYIYTIQKLYRNSYILNYIRNKKSFANTIKI